MAPAGSSSCGAAAGAPQQRCLSLSISLSLSYATTTGGGGESLVRAPATAAKRSNTCAVLLFDAAAINSH